MNNKEKLLEKKILTPALWLHRIKVYENQQDTPSIERIVIKYQPNPMQTTTQDKENLWQDMLKKKEFDIKGAKSSFNK